MTTMDSSLVTNLKQRFRQGGVLTQFIYINVGVFVIIRLLMLLRLFNLDISFLDYIQMPSSWQMLLHRPWTLFTYMFVHFDFLHILFNMLWLYWFGRIFMMYFTGRQLGGLYVLGGIAGAVLFMLAYNFLPYFQLVRDNSFLVGASASVMAIVFAVSFYQKDYQINLLFIGRIKLIYLAVGVLLLDLIAITSENAGGHIAHIGGALLGVLFAYEYKKGKDITNFMNHMIDKFVNFVTHKPMFNVSRSSSKRASQKENYGHRAETDDEYRRRKNDEERVIDEILDKLKRSGYESLSADEKKKLFDASRN